MLDMDVPEHRQQGHPQSQLRPGLAPIGPDLVRPEVGDGGIHEGRSSASKDVFCPACLVKSINELASSTSCGIAYWNIQRSSRDRSSMPACHTPHRIVADSLPRDCYPSHFDG